MEVIRAIILKSINYTETQKVIHVYSLEKGFLPLITPATVFRRKDNIIHLMQVVEIEYFENEKGYLQKLKTISPVTNNPNLYFDIFKMNIVLLWAEILSLILKGEDKNPDLYDYIVHSIDYLNTTQSDAGNFNLFFLYRLVSFLGFRINADTWKENHVFNISDGSFYPASPHVAYISGPNTAKIIHTLCCCKPEDLKNIPLNQQSRNILLDVILLFLSTHLNIDFNIKSIQVIREIFAWKSEKRENAKNHALW